MWLHYLSINALFQSSVFPLLNKRKYFKTHPSEQKLSALKVNKLTHEWEIKFNAQLNCMNMVIKSHVNLNSYVFAPCFDNLKKSLWDFRKMEKDKKKIGDPQKINWNIFAAVIRRYRRSHSTTNQSSSVCPPKMTILTVCHNLSETDKCFRLETGVIIENQIFWDSLDHGCQK